MKFNFTGLRWRKIERWSKEEVALLKRVSKCTQELVDQVNELRARNNLPPRSEDSVEIKYRRVHCFL